MEIAIVKQDLETLEGVNGAIGKWALNMTHHKPTGKKSNPGAIRDTLIEIRKRGLYKVRNSNFYIYCAECFGMRPNQTDYYLNYGDGRPAQNKQLIVPSVRKTYVYFLLSNNLIKIGFTIDVQKRISCIRTMSPSPVKLLGFMEGGRDKESALHKKFASTRMHGEWFKKTDSLLNLIREACHG